MLQIDPTLIGRKFYSHDPNTVYICRGIYVQPDSYPILIGELIDGTYSRLTTHKLTDVKFPVTPPAP